MTHCHCGDRAHFSNKMAQKFKNGTQATSIKPNSRYTKPTFKLLKPLSGVYVLLLGFYFINQVTQHFELFQMSHCSSSILLESSIDSIATKQFFTRSSSIADDETTYCPSIPSHINIENWDSDSITSAPTITPTIADTQDLFIIPTQLCANMSGGMEDASRMDHDEANTGNNNSTCNATEQATQPASNVDENQGSNQGVPQGVNMSAFMAQLQASLADQMKIMVETTLAPKLEEIAQLKEQMAQAGPPVNNVKVPISHATESKQSYASVAHSKDHSKDGDTHGETASRDETNSKTSTSTAPRVSRYSGKPVPKGDSTQYSFPKATMSDEVVEIGSLYVKAATTVGEIKSVAEEVGDKEISFQTIGLGLTKACKIVDPRFDVHLLRCVELPPTRNPKEDQVKIQGQLTLALKSEYAMTAEAQIRTLKDIVQQVIWHKTIQTIPDMPRYVGKILFEINAVNHPQQVLFALVTGIQASWYETRDHLGLQHLVKEIVNAVPMDDSGNLPSSLNSDSRIWSNIGAMVYTSSKVSLNGKYGKAIALVYANTPTGADAAQHITSAFATFASQEKAFCISGGLPIIVSPFPKNTPDSSKSKHKSRLSPVDKFAIEVIRANNRLCAEKYKVIDLTDVTDQIFEGRSIVNMTATCADAVAVLPRTVRRGVHSATRGLKFVGTLVLQKKANTCIKEEKYYRTFFLKETPEIYPLHIDSDESDFDDATFKSTSKSSKASRGQESPKKYKQTDMRTLISTITKSNPAFNTEKAGFFFTFGGRGGQRSIDIKDSYYGPHGAKYLVHEVSGAYICRYDTQAEAWARMNKTLPGVTNRQQLRKFHMSIPHTETNLSPTHSVYNGPHGHRPGAIAYTYTEDDDQEMILARMEATKRVTGSANGLVNSIFSSFDRQVIMRYLLPELDVLGMRLSIKGVQIADTETTMVFLGVHPETCPEGFKALVRKVLLLEADAMVKRKELSAIDRGTLELDDMFFKSQGIKSTRLSNPSDQARYGTEAFVDSLNRGIVMETPVGRTSSYRALLDAAVTSGLTKKYLGSRATPREIPQGNISQHNSRV